MTDNGEPGFRVTLRDVYQQQQTQLAAIGEVKRKLDSVVEARTDHEARLRTLERWMYALPVTFFLAVASVVIQWLTKK